MNMTTNTNQARLDVVYLRGVDVGERTYWAWEWVGEDEAPEFVDLARADIDQVIAQLDGALPGSSVLDVEQTDDDVRATVWLAGLTDLVRERADSVEDLRELAMVQRCLTGALTNAASERALSVVLSEVLLPASLLSEVGRRSELRGPEAVEVRVMPAPSTSRVPWEILSTRNTVHGKDDERLIDVARVVTMAPLLGRDGNPSAEHPRWDSVSKEAVLYVVDPDVRHEARLLEDDQAGLWRHRLSNPSTDVGGVQDSRVTREWLSVQLRARPLSAFYYLGHVSAGDATAGKTAFVLNDGAGVYGRGRRVGPQGDRRDLTAQDLLAGTLGMNQLAASLADSHRDAVTSLLEGRTGINEWEAAFQVEFGTTHPTLPSVATAEDGTRMEVPGSTIWPMPPRVALVACQSGSDLGHAEPFGLVSAILELGAELVLATRWTMLTDLTFRLTDESTPFAELSWKVDEMLRSAAPLEDLATWQRAKLTAWRDKPTLENSPLTWAALTAHHAPDRTIRNETKH